eukprot:407404-Hanusia_phi.AAC.1
MSQVRPGGPGSQRLVRESWIGPAVPAARAGPPGPRGPGKSSGPGPGTVLRVGEHGDGERPDLSCQVSLI